MKFNYPNDLIKSLYSFPKDILDILFPIHIPKYLIKELVEIAYHASFLTEEERQTRFKIAVISRDLVGYDSYDIDHETTLIKFEETRNLTIVELMRLAPAVDYATTLICVDSWEYEPGKAKQSLKIWGLISIGKSINKLIKLQTDQATHLPPCLVISSTAPGHIQLSQNIKPLVTLTTGKLSVIPRETKALPQPIIDILYKCCESFVLNSQIEIDSSNIFFKLKLELMVKKYIEIFCKFLFKLSDSCHGATLLFVPCNEIDFADKLLIKYKTKFSKLNSLYQEYFSESSSTKNYENVEKFNQQIDNIFDEALTLISRTSSVDGAIVINDRLEILGFGAEIRVEENHIINLYFSIGQTEKKFYSRDITEFGTRHRSAARFVKTFPRSIAFVVSQDGDKKLITYKDEKVIVYSNIVWEKMWESLEIIA